MQLRLFFPLWSMKTILGEESSAHSKEIKKIRSWAVNYLLPQITSKRFLKYPFKITITFNIYFDIEMVSLMILASQIIYDLGTHCLQSPDYRVITDIEIKTRKVCDKSGEGCEIIIESLRDKKPIH